MNLAFILLAAGNSRRFKNNKLLHPIDNKPMYLHIAEQIELLPKDMAECKILVSQYEEIMEEMKKLGYHTVNNHHSELGISHSIRLGIKLLEEEVGREKIKQMGICFVVCDQPYLKAGSISKLIREWAISKKGMGCLCNQEILGNPVVFSGRYVKELEKLEGDAGGKKVVRAHLEDVYRCEVEEKRELMDIDAFSDLHPDTMSKQQR